MSREELQRAIEYFESLILTLTDSPYDGPILTEHKTYSREMAQTALAALRSELSRLNPKPLNMEELEEMDGEVAIVKFGDGTHGLAILAWEDNVLYLYGPEFDDHSEPDLDFYAMFDDRDHDGHFGLHLLGWAAYPYPPTKEVHNV